MEIEIKDRNGILSKTQKQKIRKAVKDVWDGEDNFHDHIEKILETLHYADGIHEDLKYNFCDFDYYGDKNKLELDFKHVHLETPEERRNKLRNRLRAVLDAKKRPTRNINIDPQLQMYKQICSQIPEENRKMIPKPDQVRANLEMYKNMMTMIPNENPLYKYLSTFIPQELN